MNEEDKKESPAPIPRGAGRTINELSAGGVVVRRIGGKVHVALLKTRHARGLVWVLPKGHVELNMGESRADAAMREVKEELGIAEVKLKRALGSTRFQFMTERGRVAKTVHYFLIEGLTEELKAQAEEGLLDAQWFPVKEALRLITYPTDKKIILRAVRPRMAPVPRKEGG